MAELKIEGAKRAAAHRVPLSKIRVIPGFNTRYGAPDPGEYAALKDSIRRNGQRVPLQGQVAKDGFFDIWDGHQRLQIQVELWKETGVEPMILVTPQDGNERDAFFTSLDANIRTNLTLMDEVHNWRRMRDVYGMSTDEIAAYFHKSPATITEGLKLLNLSEAEKKTVHEKRLSDNMAKAWVKCPPELRDRLLEETFRVAEERIAKADERKMTPTEQHAMEDSQELEKPDVEDYNEGQRQHDEAQSEVPAPVQPPAPDEAGPKSRTVRRPTESDMNRAAENLQIAEVAGDKPRKLKEVLTDIDAFIEETPKCDATDLLREFKKYIARKLSAEQMETRWMKYTKSQLGEVLSDPKKGKANGKAAGKK